MKVTLSAISHPKVEGITSAEDFIGYAARVSNPANQMNTMTADRLIKYLIREKHWSPFEMVSMTVEIETTRDIGRQILRHASFRFQEFSQRYADVGALGDMFIFREARLQDDKNRQNSLPVEDEELQAWWLQAQEISAGVAKELYTEALRRGIAKEQARALLPEGLTKTRMYMSGTLRSFIHYCDLRCGNGTQLEHKEVADGVFKILETEFPNIAEALKSVSNL